MPQRLQRLFADFRTNCHVLAPRCSRSLLRGDVRMPCVLRTSMRDCVNAQFPPKMRADILRICRALFCWCIEVMADMFLQRPACAALHDREAPFILPLPHVGPMVAAEQLHSTMQAFANMIQQQQTQNQPMFAPMIQAVGIAVRAGGRTSRGVLEKEDHHRIEDFHGTGPREARKR